jgi:hypothetical protein
MSLSAEWRQAWKWLSVQLGTLIAIAPMIYGQIDWLQEIVGDKWFRAVMTLLGVLVVFNSIKKKKKA